MLSVVFPVLFLLCLFGLWEEKFAHQVCLNSKKLRLVFVFCFLSDSQRRRSISHLISVAPLCFRVQSLVFVLCHSTRIVSLLFVSVIVSQAARSLF